jgi:hypothetical protein
VAVPIFKDVMFGDDDGLVPLASTSLTDVVIVGSSHSLLRCSREVARQTVAVRPCGGCVHDS